MIECRLQFQGYSDKYHKKLIKQRGDRFNLREIIGRMFDWLTCLFLKMNDEKFR